MARLFGSTYAFTEKTRPMDTADKPRCDGKVLMFRQNHYVPT
jgi:hypothetical protein